MILSTKIKPVVSDKDAATLEFMQGKCRALYNWWVMRLRDGEKWHDVYEAKKTLQQSKQHDPELKWVYGKLLQEVYFRLGGAMDAFSCRVENGEKPGFPVRRIVGRFRVQQMLLELMESFMHTSLTLHLVRGRRPEHARTAT